MKKIIVIMSVIMLSSCTQGKNHVMESEITSEIIAIEQETYVLNPNSMKIHIIGCISERNMLEENKVYRQETYEILLDEGYNECQNCAPISHP